MSVILFLVACFTVFIVPNEAARILAVFPVPSISHQVVFRPITQELARRGHEVTVITPDPAFPKGGAPKGLTEIDVHDISYNAWQEYFLKEAEKGNIDDIPKQLGIFLKTFIVVVEAQLKFDEVQRLINDKTKTYDLIFIEACVRPALIFSHIYKNVPVILVSSLGGAPGNYELIGAPVHPILYPSFMRQKLYNLTQWEKLREMYSHYSGLKVLYDNVELEDKMLRKLFGPDTPSVNELGNNVDMLFLNIHQLFEGIRPVPPSVVYMGGLHQNSKKELPQDLKKYLDSSKNGVVYFSLGSNVDPTILPPERIQALVNVFSKLPYDVLMKWNKDELPGKTDNIKISKWLPQSDLLQHPKIKVFITQGGLQSTDEAITAGVPLIGVPMLADQWFNVEKYLYHKIGVRLDLENINEENLRHAIETVIGDESYRRNIINLRNFMHDQPMPPLERAVWWTEHVLRHGGARHLRAPAANMSWTQYLELELVFTVLVGLSVVAIVSLLSIYLVWKKIFAKFFCCSAKIKRN